MEVLPSGRRVPPFKQYFPNIGMLDFWQRRFFKYWVREFEKGRPREADTSYIFIYIYDLFDLYESKDDIDALHKLELLAVLYPDQVGEHIWGWLYDSYYKKGDFEKAYALVESNGDGWRCDNTLLDLKFRVGKELNADDVISIAKQHGFSQTALFKRKINEAREYIENRLSENDRGLLREIKELPYVTEVDEYGYSSGSVSLSSVRVTDFTGSADFVEKCLLIFIDTLDFLQTTAKRKESKKVSDNRRKKLEMKLWELNLDKPFKNPHALSGTENTCSHTYLRLKNYWEVFRKYECIHCDKVFMCECDREIATARVKHQVEGSWADSICPKCRGFDDTSMVTDGKLMYGSTFYAMHWREIFKHAYRISIRENEDELDSRRAENEIREKYKVPQIGEGWISETTLFRNLQEIFPQYEVIHHGKPDWLGRMHLDVYIPDLNIAFEYQGKQHFKAVEFFGGKESLEKTQSRDGEKARLCEENGLKLFYINEGEDFSLDTLRKILVDYL
jgi:hypothetical protein